MDDAVLDDLAALVPPLLRTLEALGFIARYLDPSNLSEVMTAAGTPDDTLRQARPRLDTWPVELNDVRAALTDATDAALAAFDDLRAAPAPPQGLRAVFRALRHLPRAQEALYPLAAALPPVNRFFLNPESRGDPAAQARLAGQPTNENTGIIHSDDKPGNRGGFSLYVPEFYTADQSWPLVMALHGGSGNGRNFLWSWLRDARSFGAIVITPTATGDTWALMGEDTDTSNLARILDLVRGRWNVDPNRLLLTGMSDGGTFSYVSGLEPESPFTHLAPVAASFHPMLAEMADPERMNGLPIYLTHGSLDWMFPVEIAHQAERALGAAGANVTFQEIPDLSHCYPREINAVLLNWLRGTSP